jgi:ABC-2 type transport system permease protein
VLTAAANGSYTIIAGIVTVLFVCCDYSQGTIKNVIARGVSRERVYLAKLIAVIIIAVALYITVILFGFLFGLILFGFDTPDSARWLGVLGVQFLAALGTAYLSFLTASAIRKVGPSILIVILVPTVVELLLTLIDLFMETHISDYFITTVFNFLSTGDVSVSRLIASLITTAVYMLLFVGGGYLLSRKSEY